MARRRNYTCSFCGKSRDKVKDLIAGPHGVYICNECVIVCNEILTHDKHTAPVQRGDAARQTVHHRPAPWWRRLLSGRRQTASAPVQA